MAWLRREGYRNRVEDQFHEWVVDKGWIPTKRGWPDFLCVAEDGRFIAVEVKSREDERLQPEQEIVCRLLNQLGLPTYRWVSGINGLFMIAPSRLQPSECGFLAREVREMV